MQKLVTVNFQLTPHVRRETHGGTEYVVAPVVAVRVGVLNGAWLPAEEIAKSVAAWNGVPLPIGHPKENGNFISVNRADILATCVGTFQRATFDGSALRGELWIDVAKATAQGGDALVTLQRLESGAMLEVSTAYETDMDLVTGSLNGHAYNGIQRNIRPDHLALLPNEVGACSVVDGCGAPRVNQQKELPMTFLQKVKAKLFGDIQTNIEQSFSEVRRALSTAIEAAEIQTANGMIGWVDVEDVYDDRVVYCVYLNGTRDPQLYSRSYTVDENGKATLGERAAVVKEVRYLPMSEPITNASKGELPLDLSPAPTPQEEPAAGAPPLSTNAHKTNCDCSACEQHATEVHMDKKELVSNVLKARGLGEEHRESLTALPEPVLEKLAINAELVPAPTGEPAPAPAVVAPAVVPAPQVPVVNADVLYLFKQFEGMSANRREELTAQIVANSDFTKEQLAAMPLDQMSQIARNIVPQANYSGRLMPRLAGNTEKHTSAPEPPPLVEPKQQAA